MASPLTETDFEQLYRSSAPQLFAYLRRRGAADPEDLVAETYVIAWRRRADLPDPDLRRAWLFGTARRLLLADARRRGRETDAVHQVARVSTAPPDSDRTRSDQVVAAALARLDPDQRELIRLVEWEGLSPAEIAVALGIRPGTARVRLHRARRSLAADPTLSACCPAHTLADSPGWTTAAAKTGSEADCQPSRKGG